MTQKASNRAIDFTQGNILQQLILFTIPIIVGELLQNLYNSVDALIVGNWAGAASLAAVSSCQTPVQLVVGFFSGMSVGTLVVIGRHIGKSGGQSGEGLQTSVCVAVSLSVCMGLILSVCACLAVPLISIVTDFPEEVRHLAELYLRLYFIGMVFVVVYNNGTGILRALGDSRSPFVILAITCLLNVVLDVLLVAIVPLGVAGAAIATTLSQMVSSVLIYRRITQRMQQSCFSLHELAENRSLIGEIFSIGLPTGMQASLVSFSNLFVWRYIGGFGTAAIAGIGVGQKLDKFISLPCKSFGTAVTAFVSQNVGARQEQRARAGSRTCLMLSLAVTYFLAGIVYLSAEFCVGLFNSSPEVIAQGVAFMRFVAPFYGFLAVRNVVLGVLRGHGCSKMPMLISVFGMVVIRQIYLYIAQSLHPSIINIHICYPLAWGAATVLIVLYYFSVRKKLGSE